MKILDEIYNKWKNAETTEAAIAYMECYFLVLEYVQDYKYYATQEMKKYHNAFVNSIIETCKARIEEYKQYDRNK